MSKLCRITDEDNEDNASKTANHTFTDIKTTLVTTVLSNLPEHVLVLNQECIVVMSNRTTASWDKQLVFEEGRKLSEIFQNHPVGKSLEQMSKSSMASKTPNHCEISLATNEYSRVFECKIIPLENEIAVTLRDVTEERRNREELTNQLQFLQLLIDAIPHPIYYSDLNERCLGCNKEFVHFVEIDRQQIIGNSIFDIFHKELAEVMIQQDKILFQTNGKNMLETRAYLRGDNRILVSHKAPYFDKDSNISGIVGILNDITDETNAKDALARQTERLEVTLLSISDAVITTDISGKVVFLNAAAENLTGWFQSEAQGEHLLKLISFHDPNNGMAFRFDTQCEEHKNRLVHLYDRKGTRRLVNLSTSPINAYFDKDLCTVLIFRDVTEQHQVEERNRLSQKMESIGQLAAGIAHEINTPMQYVGDNVRFLDQSFKDICQALELLSSLVNKNNSSVAAQEIKTHLSSIDVNYLINEIPIAVHDALEGIERVTKLVKAMKDFTHPGTNEKSLVNINHGILATITISRNNWKYVAEMITDLDPNLPPVMCNADEINQVILNLIVNAADALHDSAKNNESTKGTITVRTRFDQQWVYIFITDNGPGIEPTLRDKIFDPFFTTKEVGKGTGQGLAIAHDIIVNKHRGRIDLETKLEHGTTFTVILPLGNTET